MRKKCAIVTLYGEFNYGNRLQNYAVERCFHKWGYDVESIVHREAKNIKDILKVGLKWSCVHIFKPYVHKKYPHILREKNFQKFTKKYMHTKYYKGSIEEQAEQYDLFVVGSDQVWNPCFGGFEKIFDEMFLIGIPQEKKRCFAPSFGIEEIPDEWKEKFYTGLSTFPKLCSREDAGAKIIKRLIKKDAIVMIDPTLMLDASEWSAIENSVKGIPKEYILEYFLGETSQQYNDFINVMQNSKTKTRISMMDKSRTNIFTSGPSEFIFLIKNATLVCTDSFHACVFSILYEKPFRVFKREGENSNMFSRIYTLLGLFGIEPRDIDLNKEIHIKKEIRDKVLEEKRDEVEKFLNIK